MESSGESSLEEPEKHDKGKGKAKASERELSFEQFDFPASSEGCTEGDEPMTTFRPEDLPPKKAKDI